MRALLRQTAIVLTLALSLLLIASPAQATNPCPGSVDPCPGYKEGPEGYRQTIQVFCWGGTVWHVDEVWRFIYIGYWDADDEFNTMQTLYTRWDETYDTHQECGTGSPP